MLRTDDAGCWKVKPEVTSYEDTGFTGIISFHWRREESSLILISHADHHFPSDVMLQ